MIKSSVYLFYGEDISALRDKLAAWVERFSERFDGLLDKEELDATESNAAQLEGALRLMPLLGPKRLVVVRQAGRASKLLQEKVIALLPMVSEQVIVVFVEEGPLSTHAPLLAYLLHNATVHYFATPSPLMLRRRAEQWLLDQKLRIEPPALHVLLARTGNNAQVLQQELEKLRLGTEQEVITEALVTELVNEPLESRIFNLTDAIFDQRAGAAHSLLISELEYGTAALQILGLLITQTRRLIMMAECVKQGTEPSAYPILKTLKPFILSRLRKVGQALSLEQLIAYYMRLSLADIHLKTGADPAAVLTSVLRTS